MGRSAGYKSPSTLKRDIIRKTLYSLQRKYFYLEDKIIKFRTENILYLSRIQDKLEPVSNVSIQYQRNKPLLSVVKSVAIDIPPVKESSSNQYFDVSLSCDSKYLTTNSLNSCVASEPLSSVEPDVIHRKMPSLIDIQTLLDAKLKKHKE